LPRSADKIVAKTIPSTPVYENELVYAFRDISPTAPVHIILVPKVRGGLAQLQNATETDKPILGELLYAVAQIAKQEKLDAGYRVVINDGPQGECARVRGG
jgi:diadenosine tetraphosphate (Ap4A) HIT family hydrolase